MVSTDINRIDDCKRELKIKVSADEIDTIRQNQLQVVRQEAQIQGFRKGKAPLNMVRSMYEGTIEKYTLDEALQAGFEKGLEESNLKPVGQPVVKNFKYDDDKNLLLEVEVEVFPEIELKKYKGIKIEKTIYTIDEEDVAEQMDRIRKQKATIISVEEGAENGHFVEADLQELDETGMPLVGKKYTGVRMQLGEGKFDPDVEQQLIGVKPGEERLVEKKYSTLAVKKEQSGRVERYRAHIKKVEREELAELDDQFVKDLNANMETVNELRERVRQQLEHQWGQESEQQFYHQFAHELLQQNPFDVPESMVNLYLDQIVEEIDKKDPNVNLDDVRSNYRVDAVFNIKWYHLKERIAKVEDINATDEDFEQYLDKVDDEKIRNMYRDNPELKKRIHNDIYEKKIFDFLVDNAKVKIRSKSIQKGKETTAV